MLPPFRVRRLLPLDLKDPSSSSKEDVQSQRRSSGELTDGVIRMKRVAYDELLERHPEAALTYIDEEDGDVVLVGSALELGQRLQEQIPAQPRPRNNLYLTLELASTPPLHAFDIKRDEDIIKEWLEIERQTRENKSKGKIAFGQASPLAQNAPSKAIPQHENAEHHKRWASYSSLPAAFDPTKLDVATEQGSEVDAQEGTSQPKSSEASQESKLENTVRYYRFKLQKGLLESEYPAKTDFDSMSNILAKLEALEDLDGSIIKSTKIYKVLNAIRKTKDLVNNEKYQFKVRSLALLMKWPSVTVEGRSATCEVEDSEAWPKLVAAEQTPKSNDGPQASTPDLPLNAPGDVASNSTTTATSNKVPENHRQDNGDHLVPDFVLASSQGKNERSPEELRLASYNDTALSALRKSDVGDRVMSTTFHIPPSHEQPLLELFQHQLMELGASNRTAKATTTTTSSAPDPPEELPEPQRASPAHTATTVEEILTRSVTTVMAGVTHLALALQQTNSELQNTLNLAGTDFPRGLNEAIKASAAAIDAVRGITPQSSAPPPPACGNAVDCSTVPANAEYESDIVSQPKVVKAETVKEWIPERLISRRLIFYEHVHKTPICQYLVRWVGHGPEKDVWYDESRLIHLQRLKNDYVRTHGVNIQPQRSDIEIHESTAGNACIIGRLTDGVPQAEGHAHLDYPSMPSEELSPHMSTHTLKPVWHHMPKRAPTTNLVSEPLLPESKLTNRDERGAMLTDYQMQLMLLEQQNKRRLMMARQEQEQAGYEQAGREEHEQEEDEQEEDEQDDDQQGEDEREDEQGQVVAGAQEKGQPSLCSAGGNAHGGALTHEKMQSMLLEQQNQRRLVKEQVKQEWNAARARSQRERHAQLKQQQEEVIARVKRQRDEAMARGKGQHPIGQGGAMADHQIQSMFLEQQAEHPLMIARQAQNVIGGTENSRLPQQMVPNQSTLWESSGLRAPSTSFQLGPTTVSSPARSYRTPLPFRPQPQVPRRSWTEKENILLKELTSDKHDAQLKDPREWYRMAAKFIGRSPYDVQNQYSDLLKREKQAPAQPASLEPDPEQSPEVKKEVLAKDHKPIPIWAQQASAALAKTSAERLSDYLVQPKAMRSASNAVETRFDASRYPAINNLLRTSMPTAASHENNRSSNEVPTPQKPQDIHLAGSERSFVERAQGSPKTHPLFGLDVNLPMTSNLQPPLVPRSDCPVKSVAGADEPAASTPPKRLTAEENAANIAANIAANQFPPQKSQPQSSILDEPVSEASQSSRSGSAYLVFHGYQKEEDGEIDLVKGEYLKNVERISRDTWTGENGRGEVGRFPSKNVDVEFANCGPCETLLRSPKRTIPLPPLYVAIKSCTAQLEAMGFGPTERTEAVATAAEGKLERALEILEEDENEWKSLSKGKGRVVDVDDELYH